MQEKLNPDLNHSDDSRLLHLNASTDHGGSTHHTPSSVFDATATPGSGQAHLQAREDTNGEQHIAHKATQV